MLLKCFVLLCSVISCLSKREIGGACVIPNEGFTNIAGICKPIDKCPYAIKVLYTDEKKPAMCWWEGEVRIVCCPLNNTMFRTGDFGRLYDPLSDGVKRSGTTICRYDGDRHQCCPVVPDRPLPEETGCAPLDKPKPPPTLTAVQLVAWNKCVENLRFVKQCIATPGDRHRHIRQYECGIKDQAFRISGGRPAEPKEFPHMVVLGVAEDSDGGSDVDAEWVGGGALISDKFVLTAAHVLVDPSGRPLRYALLGTLNKTDALTGLLHIIVRKIPHDLYDSHKKQHDIALVELDRRVTLSSFVRPICLPVPGQATDRTARQAELHIAGWGRTGVSENAAQLLQTTQISVQSDYSECQMKLGSSNFQFNSSTMLCVKDNRRDRAGNKSRDSCPGDSGGPLMAVLSDVPCSYSAEGVVSFGPSCGQGAPGVYTRVELYLEWIVRNVWPDDWQRAKAFENKSD